MRCHKRLKIMSKIFEVIDSLNDENVSDVESLKETLKAEADALDKSNKQLYHRAKTAEGFTYDKNENKWIKKEVKEVKPEAKSKKTNEPDYARLAFLEQRGLTNVDDQKLVQDEAERLKMPLTVVLGMEYIQSKLKASKDQREADAGMPKGRGNSGSQTKNDVDYWLAKGETPDNQELAEKVIAARIKSEGVANKFSDDLYSG